MAAEAHDGFTALILAAEMRLWPISWQLQFGQWPNYAGPDGAWCIWDEKASCSRIQGSFCEVRGCAVAVLDTYHPWRKVCFISTT